MTISKYEVGKPFPGVYPKNQGAVLELTKSGIVVFIQMPGLTSKEKKAFKKSFKTYGFWEASKIMPIAVWSFLFPKPFGEIDCNFNARIVNPEYIKDYLTPESGQLKNAIQFFLLDGNILKGAKLVGLHQQAVTLFHKTIKKQLKVIYSQEEYNYYLNIIYQQSTKNIYMMSTKFHNC